MGTHNVSSGGSRILERGWGVGYDFGKRAVIFLGKKGGGLFVCVCL